MAREKNVFVSNLPKGVSVVSTFTYLTITFNRIFFALRRSLDHLVVYSRAVRYGFLYIPIDCLHYQPRVNGATFISSAIYTAEILRML